MFNTPWGVELSENIQNIQIDQVEDKKNWSKKMKKVENEGHQSLHQFRYQVWLLKQHD